MITLEEAKKIALEFINEGVNPNFPIVIINEEIFEYPEGFIFGVNTKQYVEDGNSDFRISGLSPIFVDKEGDVFDYYENEYLYPETIIKQYRSKKTKSK